MTQLTLSNLGVVFGGYRRDTPDRGHAVTVDALPMFPLGAVLLPGELLPLQVFEPRYLEMIAHLTSSPDLMRFGVVLISRGHEVGGGDQRTDVGTVARIIDCEQAPGGRLLLGCVGERRIRVRRWLPDDPYPRADVEPWPDGGAMHGAEAIDEVGALVDELGGLLSRSAAQHGIPAPEFPRLDELPGEMGDRVFALAASLPLVAADRLRLLSAPGPGERLTVLAEALGDVIAAVRFRLSE
ncbi:LON peptidase substrate-binding domain-containing protein [Rhodococcus sp. NPDC058514]|uniref:LON peptidase substrate-binding domain-containing protein n=1 Tax=unclassified Rhodococcus (in: high G+C Gram-positive bacteria) TaxID=192944 RepID=UPI003648D244